MIELFVFAESRLSVGLQMAGLAKYIGLNPNELLEEA